MERNAAEFDGYGRLDISYAHQILYLCGFASDLHCSVLEPLRERHLLSKISWWRGFRGDRIA
jgi:hypothetical protein